MDRKETLLQAPTQVLVTHAVLLLRTVNRYESKEKQLSDFARYYSKEILADYIVHFFDSVPEKSVEQSSEPNTLSDGLDGDYYMSSATAGDYGPSCPWNAPGMSVSDFI